MHQRPAVLRGAFLLEKGRWGDEGNDFFLEPKKETKKAACGVKVKLIKLEGSTAAPPAAPWQVKA